MEGEVRDKMSEIPKENFKASFDQLASSLQTSSTVDFADLFLAE